MFRSTIVAVMAYCVLSLASFSVSVATAEPRGGATDQARTLAKGKVTSRKALRHAGNFRSGQTQRKIGNDSNLANAAKPTTRTQVSKTQKQPAKVRTGAKRTPIKRSTNVVNAANAKKVATPRKKIVAAKKAAPVKKAASVKKAAVSVKKAQASTKLAQSSPVKHKAITRSAKSHIVAAVKRHAAANGVPVGVALAIVRQESNFRPHVTGSAGEIGLMQVKCSTARGEGFKGSCSTLYQVEHNLRYGMRYLKKALRRGSVGYFNAGIHAKSLPASAKRYARQVAALQ